MKKNEVYGRSVPINFNPLFRVMKLCLLFTVMLNLSVVAATNAQLKKVSLIMENAELRQVFKKIKQQTGVRFFYNEEKLKNIGNRRIEIHDLELEKALDGTYLHFPAGCCGNQRQGKQSGGAGNSDATEKADPGNCQR